MDLIKQNPKKSSAMMLGIAAISLFFIQKSSKNSIKNKTKKLKTILESCISEGFSQQLFDQLSQIHNNKILKPLNKISEQTNSNKPVACHYMFEEQSPKYYCLDCANEQSIKKLNIMCEECYNASNHRGHQVVQVSQTDKCMQSCTCGDPNYIKSQGFCKNHSGNEYLLSIQNYQKTQKEEDFNIFWGNLFFILFQNIESCIELNLDINVKNNIRTILQNVIQLIIDCSNDQNFLNLMGKFMSRKILDQQIIQILNQKNEDEQQLYHDCNNLKEISFLNEFQRQNQECNCSNIENLIRFISFYDKKVTDLLAKIILILRPVPTFSEHFSAKLPKLINYIYIYHENGLTRCLNLSFNEVIRVVDRFAMPYMNGDLLVNSEYFDNFQKCFDNLVDNYNSTQSKHYLLAVQSFLSLFEFLAQQKSVCLKLVKNKDFIQTIFHIMSKIEQKSTAEFSYIWEGQKYYTDELPLLTLLGYCHIQCIQLFKHIFQSIEDLNKDEQYQKLQSICQMYRQEIDIIKKKRALQNNTDSLHYNCVSLTSSFSFLILRISKFEKKELNKTNLSYIMKVYFKIEDQESQKNFYNDLVAILNKYKFSYLDEHFMEQVQDYQTTQAMYFVYQVVRTFYLSGQYGVNDTAILSWQICILGNSDFIMEEYYLNQLNKIVSKEDQQNNKTQDESIQNMIHKLNSIFNIEQYWANIQYDVNNNDQEVLRILKINLVSFLHSKGSSVSMKDIKDFISKQFPENTNLEQILDSVADFDIKQKKFIIKKEFDNIGNLMSISQNIKKKKYYDDLKEKAVQNKEFDQYMLKDVNQEKKCVYFLEQMKESLFNNPIMQKIIKIILQDNNEIFGFNTDLLYFIDNLVQVLENNLMDLDLIDTFITNDDLDKYLKKLKSSKYGEDYKVSISKLRNRVYNIHKKTQENQGIEFLKQQSSMQENVEQIKQAEILKKQKIKEKQQKLMEKFKKKRNNFQENKQTVLLKSASINEEEISECILCHEKMISGSQKICFPVFIKQSNINFYFELKDNKNLSVKDIDSENTSIDNFENCLQNFEQITQIIQQNSQTVLENNSEKSKYIIEQIKIYAQQNPALCLLDLNQTLALDDSQNNKTANFDFFIKKSLNHLQYLDIEDFINQQQLIFKQLLLPQQIEYYIDISNQNQNIIDDFILILIKLYRVQQHNFDLNFSQNVFSTLVLNIVEILKSKNLNINEDSFEEIQFSLKIFTFLIYIFEYVDIQEFKVVDLNYLKGYTELFEKLFGKNLIEIVENKLKDQIIIKEEIQKQQNKEIEENKNEEEIQFMKPILLNLPSNYSKFAKEFSERKCQKCNQIALQQQSGEKQIKLLTGTAVCLLCNQSFCKTTCGNKRIPRDSEMVTGNLNNHAKEFHNGIGIFIESKQPNIILLHYPLNIILKPIYINKYGEQITNDDVDWKNFYLDKLFVSQLEKLVLNNQLPSYIVQKLSYYDDPDQQYYKNQLL